MLTGISLSHPDLEDTIEIFLTDVQQIWSYCEQQVGLAYHKDRKQGNTAIPAPYKYLKNDLFLSSEHFSRQPVKLLIVSARENDWSRPYFYLCMWEFYFKGKQPTVAAAFYEKEKVIEDILLKYYWPK